MSPDPIDENNIEMAPQEDNLNSSKNQKHTVNDVNVVESDLREIEAVNDSLEELSSALDTIEQKTENIMAKLMELLNSNKEIRQSLAAENSKQ